MKRLMSITATGKPSFDGGIITIPLANENRIYNRMESLAMCLCSNGFEYEIDIAIKREERKLTLIPIKGSQKKISSCDQLLAVLEACGFSYHVMLTSL